MSDGPPAHSFMHQMPSAERSLTPASEIQVSSLPRLFFSANAQHYITREPKAQEMVGGTDM